MLKLNFPVYKFRFKNKENTTYIFDRVRKKFVVLTPEEWVRQHCVNFLIENKGYPESYINVEKQLKINTPKVPTKINKLKIFDNSMFAFLFLYF